jgi:hypothetical protein
LAQAIRHSGDFDHIILALIRENVCQQSVKFAALPDE